MNKSQIFTQYNKARAAAADGKLDAMRVNRALSVLQSADGESKLKQYHTTINSCRCQDHQHRPGTACKHMIAAMVLFRASQASKTAPAAATQTVDSPHVSTAPNGDVVMAEQQPGGFVLHTFENSGQYAAWHNLYTRLEMVKPSEVHGKKLAEQNHKEF